jgi:hypothetical protein
LGGVLRFFHDRYVAKFVRRGCGGYFRLFGILAMIAQYAEQGVIFIAIDGKNGGFLHQDLLRPVKQIAAAFSMRASG